MKNVKEETQWEKAYRLREARRSKERQNSLMQCRHEVVYGVLGDAKKILNEIWDVCVESTPPEKVLREVNAKSPANELPSCGWPELREKIHLLAHYVDYSFRLLKVDAVNSNGDSGGPGIRTRQ